MGWLKVELLRALFGPPGLFMFSISPLPNPKIFVRVIVDHSAKRPLTMSHGQFIKDRVSTLQHFLQNPFVSYSVAYSGLTASGRGRFPTILSPTSSTRNSNTLDNISQLIRDRLAIREVSLAQPTVNQGEATWIPRSRGPTAFDNGPTNISLV